MSLPSILQALEVRRRAVHEPYFVPSLWANSGTQPDHTAAVQVNPYDFYYQILAKIAIRAAQPLVQGVGGEWSRHAMVYSLFPRLTTAFDHNGDGEISSQPNSDGWRETGTLLKSMALLPYIREMGFNTVHLLPVTAIGRDGRKGALGSPYAIRNPYVLDENLAEPALGLTAEQLFKGFVEAAHRLGMRVVVEFVLRTAAKDSDWIPEHPEWFYWIRADVPDRAANIGRTGALNSYGQPLFSPDTLNLIFAKINAGDFHDLPPPPHQYRAMFTPPPRPDQVRLEGGRYIGTLDDGTRVRIPGAFADWPPNDVQPPWSDVTYLRLYDHPDFNYMAYNTLRMYDSFLAQPEHRNAPLWERLIGVIPHYQQTFSIDGVLIDMGHALPMPLKQRIIATARAIDPDFAFWDENFSIDWHTREQGYNAVVGYWLLSLHEPHSVRSMINQMAQHAFPIAFFSAMENHNTPRAFARFGGVAYAHYALALSIGIPAIPFIQSGFELGETQPLNTGLGFSGEEIRRYTADDLPLFGVGAYDWCRAENWIRSVRHALGIRHKFESLLSDSAPNTFLIGSSDNPHILVFSRRRDDQWLCFIANMDMAHEQRGRAIIRSKQVRVAGYWGTYAEGMDVQQEIAVNISLSPGYVLIIDVANLRQGEM